MGPAARPSQPTGALRKLAKVFFWFAAILGIVVMLGHIALALVPGVSGLVLGLVCIALGSGGVKSSASSMVGALYENPQWHALRDAGFSIFYLAVNIGGFFGPLLTGVLQTEMGFHYGFGAAALGMAFGLWRYARGRAGLPQPPGPKQPAPPPRPRAHPHRPGSG